MVSTSTQASAAETNKAVLNNFVDSCENSGGWSGVVDGVGTRADQVLRIQGSTGKSYTMEEAPRRRPRKLRPESDA